MPAMTVVVLKDREGSEFPIGFVGTYNPNPQEDRWLREKALERAAEFVKAGDFRPVGTLRFDRIEAS